MRKLIALVGVAAVIGGGVYIAQGGSLSNLTNLAATLQSQSVNAPHSLKIIDISTSPTPDPKTDKLLIRWQSNYSGETGYTVEKSLDNKTWKEFKKLTFDQAVVYPVNAVLHPSSGQLVTREVVDAGPFVADQVAYYRVKADASAYSNVANGWVSKGHPTKPTTVTATVVDSKLVLSWIDPNQKVLRFEIDREQSGGPWAQITTIDFDPNRHSNYSYTDYSAIPGYAYQYRVRAINSRGPSNYAESNQVSYVSHPAENTDTQENTPVPPPVSNRVPVSTPPHSFDANNPAGPVLTVKYSRSFFGLGDRKVKLNWTALSAINEYMVYWLQVPTTEISSASNANLIQHFNEPNTTTYTGAYPYTFKIIHGNPEYIMGGLQPGYTYYFKVRAQVNATTHTDMSNVVVVKVP